MTHQALHAAKALRQGDHLQGREKLPDIVLFIQFEGDHGTAVFRLSAVDLIALCIRQSGIIDVPDR